MARLGELDANAGQAALNGVHRGIIIHIDLDRNPDGTVRVTKNDLQQDQRFVIVKVQFPNGVLSRKFPYAWTYNKRKSQWSLWTQFIEALTGIRCGDPRQQEVDTDQLIGTHVDCLLQYKPSSGYTDILNFTRVAEQQPAAPAAPPAPAPPPTPQTQTQTPPPAPTAEPPKAKYALTKDGIYAAGKDANLTRTQMLGVFTQVGVPAAEQDGKVRIGSVSPEQAEKAIRLIGNLSNNVADLQQYRRRAS